MSGRGYIKGVTGKIWGFAKESYSVLNFGHYTLIFSERSIAQIAGFSGGVIVRYQGV